MVNKLNKSYRGVAQLVARMVRDHEVVGSNPVASTNESGIAVAIPFLLHSGEALWDLRGGQRAVLPAQVGGFYRRQNSGHPLFSVRRAQAANPVASTTSPQGEFYGKPHMWLAAFLSVALFRANTTVLCEVKEHLV